MAKKNKKSKPRFIVNEADAELFKDVVFLVECTHNESFTFWKDYHYEPRKDTPVVKKWEQEMAGHMVCIGELDKRPVCVSIFYAKLNGKRVAFYEGTSQVVDHLMIEEWLHHWTLEKIRWDNGHRWAHCDSSNFHHCLDAIGVLDEYREEREKAKLQASKGAGLQP